MKQNLSKLSAALVLGTLLSGAAFAQAADPHAGHTMAAPSSKSTSASNAAYEQANAKMHKDMAVPLTGDADVDFLAGMIPHHQGAIDMAEVVLKYGKDPKVKKLAQDIVVAQKKEIAMMQTWLKDKKATK
ncbi:MAG: DUF305 domain-containing protein [Rhodoferax sp.]|uniref:CopM family metallochaperone n=1 Tax=Rhodoferax sp. TaxID=50421 RepID=UPI0026041E24|nr:DUF305 domain-containing protein [Rhodoferax sp.]MDD2878850.1 DUF305 domain-containing protein [Rhodoferax sp.]